MKSKYIFLLFIILLGIFLRFYNIGKVPDSLNWDEVSIGYNAYSLLQTGKDEYGRSFPLIFESYGDFKQPVYFYLAIIPVKFLGLTPLAVRLPSAILGTISILIIYFLVKEIFIDDKNKERLALFASILFAISPWSIQFSRVGYEANAALFFIMLGAVSLLYGIRTKNTPLSILGIILLGVSTYTYHSAKVFSPLLLLVLLFPSFIRKSMSFKKIIIFGFILFAIAIPWILDSNSLARGRSLSFTNDSTLLKNNTSKIAEDKYKNIPLSGITHNRRIVYLNTFLENYASHFDPNYLFLRGDNARHHAPGMGILYLVSLPFILIGFYQIIKRKNTQTFTVISWLLISPLTAAIAINAPSAVRNFVMLPSILILGSLGLNTVMIKLQGQKRSIGVIFITGFYLLNFFVYFHRYFALTNPQYQLYWQYGYKEGFDFLKSYDKEKIFISDKIEQGYTFFLFYNKYDPKKYLAEGGSTRRYNKCFNIDNYYFGDCKSKENTGDLYMTITTENTAPNTVILKEIPVDKDYNIKITKISSEKNSAINIKPAKNK